VIVDYTLNLVFDTVGYAPIEEPFTGSFLHGVANQKIDVGRATFKVNIRVSSTGIRFNFAGNREVAGLGGKIGGRSETYDLAHEFLNAWRISARIMVRYLFSGCQPNVILANFATN